MTDAAAALFFLVVAGLIAHETSPVEAAVERRAASAKRLHGRHDRAGEHQEEGARRPASLPGRVELAGDGGEPALVVGEVLGLVDDDDERLGGAEVEQQGGVLRAVDVSEYSLKSVVD